MIPGQIQCHRALIVLLILPLVWIAQVQAEINVSPEMFVLIETATNTSYEVYPVDKEKHHVLLNLVDKWAQSQIPLDDVQKIKDKSSDRITWVKDEIENNPIFPGEKEAEGVSPQGSFRIKYVRKSVGRSFVKSIRMPVSHRRTDEDVFKIGRRFIELHEFVAQTEADQMGRQIVVNRLIDVVESGDSEKKILTILQRAIFKRTLDGLEVFNSRQIVDIHPESGEILAYKGLEWAPAKESDRKTVRPLPAEELLKTIKEAFKHTSNLYHVTEVKKGMYQSEEMIFPVLSVFVERARDKSNVTTLKQILYVPISEIGSTKGRKHPRRLPEVTG